MTGEQLRDPADPRHMIGIESDGVTVWVQAFTGTIARFGTNGIDVHTRDTTGCLHCTHERTTSADWQTFREKVREHHGIDVSEQHRPHRFGRRKGTR